MKHRPTAAASARPVSLLVALASVATVAFAQPAGAPLGRELPRSGDEIVVAGRMFHTTTPVVLWTDPGGYDAYRVERRFAPWDKADWRSTEAEAKLDTPARYGLRGATPDGAPLDQATFDHVRGGGWSLDELRGVVDQFVMHYDVCGSSQTCFRVLHDERCLSVHFMLDVDGTIYQTLDLKERAWHATTSNTRSIGVEIAHMGAYPARARQPLDRWYATDADGRVRLTPPKPWGDLGVRTANFVGRPARNEIVEGEVQKTVLFQYDFTTEQYGALTKLTAALCRVFPKLKCDYPRDAAGKPLLDKLPDAQLREYSGVLGHFHIQENKTDPGPAFDWARVVGGARNLIE
ncbi:MAG: N-acetylmuramoyl-L-alanine amidase [Lacipirellulaceae bacterium]